MGIKVISSENVDFKEKDVQKAIELDLPKLEEGLEFIASEVILGTGRVDTLAFDTESGQPVFIEYKSRGQFSKDALIQLMDYLSWFTRDPNHMLVLEKLIRQTRPDIEDIEHEIRLICVVHDIDERIRNAIYAMENWVKVYSYLVIRDTNDTINLIPKLEVDNYKIERTPPVGRSEAEILNGHPNFKELYEKLKPILERDGSTTYTKRSSICFKKERVFAKLRFRKKYILLRLKAGQNRINDNDFKYLQQGASPWGSMHIYTASEITEKIISWIEIARKYSSETDISSIEEEHG